MVEQLLFSIREEPATIHALLWDDQDDLVRAIVVLSAALEDRGTEPLIVSAAVEELENLRALVSTRPAADAVVQDFRDTLERSRLWLVFLRHGAAEAASPWLNGYRRPLAQDGGSLLIIRISDFGTLQRCAPDLTSFVGPRIYNASSMLFEVSREVYAKLTLKMSSKLSSILKELPGEMPSEQSLQDWMRAMAPIDE